MNKQDIPARIEELRQQYKAYIDGPLLSNEINKQHHQFTWEGNFLTVDLSFSDMDSPTGFPYRRLNCKLKVNGKRITKAELKTLFATED